MSQKHQSYVFKKFGKQKDHDEYSFYFMSRFVNYLFKGKAANYICTFSACVTILSNVYHTNNV